MKCPNCNKTYDEEFKFCPYCGEEKPKPKICPNCNLEQNAEFTYCTECGTELIEKEESMRMRQEKYNKRIRSNLIKYVNDTIDYPILKEYLINQIKGGLINSIFDLDYKLDLVKDNPKFILKTIVKKTELDSNLKSLLIYRINENKIRTENELKQEIEKIRELRKEEELRKTKEKSTEEKEKEQRRLKNLLKEYSVNEKVETKDTVFIDEHYSERRRKFSSDSDYKEDNEYWNDLYR